MLDIVLGINNPSLFAEVESEKFSLTKYFEEGVPEVFVLNTLENASSGCELTYLQSKDGCEYKAIDDLKWLYECHLKESVSDEGASVSCDLANLPSERFC